MHWIRKHATFANIVSLVALSVALGGTSYAAATLARNSVGARQLKNSSVTSAKIRSNAVTSSKVRNGSLTASDFRSGVLNSAASSSPGPAGPAGPRGLTGATGPAGATGATGPAGTARAFARIDESGILIGGASQAKGIIQANIQHNAGVSAAESTGPGVYCIGGLGFAPTSASVSTDNTDAMPAIPATTGGSLNFISTAAIFKGEDLGYCDAAHGQARVAIQRVDQTTAPTLTNHGFFIWFEG